MMSKKVEVGTLLFWNDFLVHVRGFVCVENEVLSIMVKSIMYKKWNDCVELTTKTSHVRVVLFLRKRRLETCLHAFMQRAKFFCSLNYSRLNE